MNIQPVSTSYDETLQQKIDGKTKPLGSLGRLEALALQIGRIQQTDCPQLNKPVLAVFAGDHGIAENGLVNPFPQAVTMQMVMNFLAGGAAVNVLAKKNDMAVEVIDAGVNYDFTPKPDGLIDAKIAMGTKNYLLGAAMTREECDQALAKGAQVVMDLHAQGSNVIGFGEMGIGNTSSAALIMSVLCDLPIADCVGRGTGADGELFKTKLETLKLVLAKHKDVESDDALDVLSRFGGFEVAQICGGILKAAQFNMVVMVDGFIASAAALVAKTLQPAVLDYCVFAHHSEEKGHGALLEFMGVKGLLDLGMRLGEGSGVAVAYPLLESACEFVNNMASFESAGVSEA